MSKDKLLHSFLDFHWRNEQVRRQSMFDDTTIESANAISTHQNKYHSFLRKINLLDAICDKKLLKTSQK